jgi:uncharacterized coiled-coil DUF342 family protein
MPKPMHASDSPPAQAIITYEEYAKMRDDTAADVLELRLLIDHLREEVKELRAEIVKLSDVGDKSLGQV